MPTDDFRDYLRQELVRRCHANPRYSQRAFSRFLGVESAFLSKLLSGKRPITLRTLRRFQGPLGLEPWQIDRFKAKLAGIGESLDEMPTPSYETLSLDAFQIVSEWYHLAILELFRVKGFRSDARWIARRLGLAPTEVTLALERMARVGLVEKTRRGWRATNRNHSTASFPQSTAALRQLQRKVLEMAAQALEEVPIEKRDQSTVTMAIDSRSLPAAKKELAAFRRKFCQSLQDTAEQDSVYQLCISFYPVTREGETS